MVLEAQMDNGLDSVLMEKLVAYSQRSVNFQDKFDLMYAQSLYKDKDRLKKKLILQNE